MLKQQWQRDRRWWDDHKSYYGGYQQQSIGVPGWIKRSVMAAVLFILAYAAYGYDSPVTTPINHTVNYTLNHQTDWTYWWQKTQEFRAQQLNATVFKNISPVLIRPADPLQYMTAPVEAQMTGAFGWQNNTAGTGQFFREGVEFEAPLGTSVKCAAPGMVKSISSSTQYVKVLIIDHGTDIETVYGYISDVLVHPGEQVSQGQVIARVGKIDKNKTGLLFGVRQQGKAVDPGPRLQHPVGP